MIGLTRGVLVLADVDGIASNAIPQTTVNGVLGAFPRLQLSIAAAVNLCLNHCRRKPASQIGWLDILCHKVAPNADRGSVEQEIASAPFAE